MNIWSLSYFLHTKTDVFHKYLNVLSLKIYIVDYYKENLRQIKVTKSKQKDVAD